MPTRRIARFAPGVVIAAAFAHNLWLSWRKWGSVIVDVGRELELPRRMLEGDRLYVDVRNLYGTFAPYLNMWLYRLFGVHADVLMFAGIASAALMCLALYLLALRFLERWSSTLVVVVFLYACAFAHL